MKDSLLELIDAGREGRNIGLTTGIEKLDEDLCGIQRATITILGGGTGSGKTSFALYSYIYAPLKVHLEDDRYRIVYFSLEMTKEMLEAKLLSLYIYDNYSIVLNYNDILSRKTILTDDMYLLVKECLPWMEKVRKVLTIYDSAATSEKIGTTLYRYAEKHGIFFNHPDGSTSYTPNNENEVVMVIVDHLGLVSGPNKKQVADDTSAIMMQYRKVCKYSALQLMQINRGASSMDRRTNSMQEIELGDFKNSSNPLEDSDVVLALFNPIREKMTTYQDYPIKIMRDRIRSVLILKSRFGVGETGKVLNFFGEIGLFLQMPDADTIEDGDWSKYTRLGYKKELDEDENVNVNEDPKTVTFRF